MSEPYHRDDLERAIQIARHAGSVIRRYDSNRDTLDINYKGRNDLVTEADVAVEQEIITRLTEACPQDHILAEESGGAASPPRDRTWIIDPIDGTTNFAHGFPMYCVSIALWQDCRPLVGVVYEVWSDELFAARAGYGAWLNGESIRVSGIKELGASLITTGFPYQDLSLVDEYLGLFRRLMTATHGVRRPGSAAYDLCLVAAGRCEGFYEYALNAWDVAAGALIVQEAGGVVTDWNDGEDWLFGKRLIAGNPSIRRHLQQLITQHISPQHRTTRHGA